jgi:uncharacterized membrane protein YheB (UPF0754 family)
MAAKKQNKKEPTWHDQLVNIGMSERSIADMTFKPGDHEFFVKMNDTFKDALKTEMKELVGELLVESNNAVCKDIAEIVVAQNNKMSMVITEIMNGMEKVIDDFSYLKKEIIKMKSDNENVHDELKNEIKKLASRNKFSAIVVRLLITAIITSVITFFVVKYFHNHVWASNLMSIFNV